MTAIDTVNRVFRDFRRYTGDGLPGEPVNAPLPVGDPQSGVHSPKKAELREALLAPLVGAEDAVIRAGEQADRAEGEADDAEAAATRAENAAASFSEIGTNFKTVSNLLADLTLGYTGSAADVEVDVGDIVTAQGFRYEVAASGASDHHIETAGGVKLYVLPGEGGRYPAQAFADTLNDAMAIINASFSNRIGISVPPGMSITDTVEFGVDCDLFFGGWVSIDADVETIFSPLGGWSGTATPCEIHVNNHSCKIGWELIKVAPETLGTISIDRHKFRDVGDANADTSADQWIAFYIGLMGIEKLDLYTPTTIDSYVHPDGETGNNVGPNRNIILEGRSGHTIVSNINIFHPTAINLTPEEDADAFVISVGSSFDLFDIAFNVDVHGGYTKNVQRRAYKINGVNNRTSGIRFHGDAYAETTDSILPLSCIDVTGDITIDWNGTLTCIGTWIEVLGAWNGAEVRGNLFINAENTQENIVGGYSVRCVYAKAVGNPTNITIGGVRNSGGAEVLRVDAGSSLTVNGKVEHTGIHRVGQAGGELRIEELYADLGPGGSTGGETYVLSSLNTSIIDIDRIEIHNNSGAAVPHGIRLLGEGSRLGGGKFSGFSVSPVRFDNGSKMRFQNLSAPDGGGLIRGYGAGSKILIENCAHPTTVFTDVNSGHTSVTKVNDLIW